MSNLILHRNESQAIALPEPRGGAIAIRQAELRDVKFIDDLQRKHAKMVGWFPTKQLEANITKGKILIAEEIAMKAERQEGNACMPACLHASSVPVGYVIAHDKYLKREELGIVYQLNVVPSKHRGLIGASLIKEVFHRAAYGCKLFCCWCAQDLQANYFWESLGFVPLAFRTGSRPRITKSGKTTKPGRTHIFWQRRIREGDVDTPYWFPSETSGGALKENRLVLPIPPGTSWQDAKPAVLPGMEHVNCVGVLPPGAQGESSGGVKKDRKAKVKVAKPAARPQGGLWFAPPKPAPGSAEEKAAKEAAKAQKPNAKSSATIPRWWKQRGSCATGTWSRSTPGAQAICCPLHVAANTMSAGSSRPRRAI